MYTQLQNTSTGVGINETLLMTRLVENYSNRDVYMCIWKGCYTAHIPDEGQVDWNVEIKFFSSNWDSMQVFYLLTECTVFE